MTGGGAMKLQRIGFTALACLAATPAFANTWSGILVDSRCYASEERSVNPNYTYNHAYRDTDEEIRVCSPNAKTKSFSIVVHSGYGFKLDPAGSERAAEIVRQKGTKHRVNVTITGEMSKDGIEVGSISVDK
jgi:hypothetical protein